VAERERFDLARGDSVLRVRRLRLVEEEEMMVDDVVLPLTRFADIEAGAALLEIARTAYGFGDEPVERRSSRMRSARHYYPSELA